MLKESPKTTCTVIFSEKFNGPSLTLADGLELPIRGATELDRAFILSTWVKSYSQFLRKWLSPALVEEEVRQAEVLWNKATVLGMPDDEFTVLAWVCASAATLHYVYVPPELRNKGIARALIQHACGPTFQHGRPWPFKGKVTGGTYNPYLLGREPESERSNEGA